MSAGSDGVDEDNPAEVQRALLELAANKDTIFGVVGPLAGLATALRRFITNPVGFVFGVLAAGVLIQIEFIVRTIVAWILEAWGGTEPFATPFVEQQRGIADIPILALRDIQGAMGGVGSALLGAIGFLQGQINAAASAAGPFAPVVVVGLWGILAVVAAVALRALLGAVAARLGLGPLLRMVGGVR